MSEGSNHKDRDDKSRKERYSFRLPRERDSDYGYVDSGPTILEQAFEILGDRLVASKLGFRLDGKPANIDKVIATAGLKYKDAV